MSNPVVAVLGDAQNPHLHRWIAPVVQEAEVHLISIARLETPLSGVTPHLLPRPLGNKLDYFLALPRLNAILRELRPALIHAHYATSYGFLAARADVSCPRLLTVWGSDVAQSPWQNPLIRALMRRSLPCFDWINPAAPHLADFVIALGGKPEAIESFPYGIDVAAVPWAPRPRSNDGTIRILSSRRWERFYRVDEVIRGFDLYASRDARVELVITGKGPPRDERRIRQLVANAAHSERIRLLGFLPRKQLDALIQETDILVSIPTTDGAPTSLLETMAAGVFPVVSDIPANRAWIAPPQGILIDDLAPAAMAGAIAGAVEAVRGGFDGTRNRRRVEADADYRTNAERLRQTYRRILHGTTAE